MLPTLLVVDDEAALLRAMQRLLRASFEVRGAACVSDALKLFDGTIDAVLTDFSMPDGDGLSLATRLRELGYRGPIAVLSALVSEPALQQAVAAGTVSELIDKPWRSADLVERIKRLCPAPTAAGV